jgi:hypothetical protein
MFGVITNLQCFKVGIENLDYLILIIKIWPNDAHVRCDGVKA